MRIRIASKPQAAGTLVETIVAITILVIMAAGILNSFGYGFFVTQVVRENQRATQIILEKFETFRLYSWSQVNSNGFIPPTFSEVYDPQSPAAPGITYQGTISVGNLPPPATSYSANLRQLTVNLSWTTGSRIPHTRTMTTLIAKDGLQNYVY
jgi:type II secretory pathway pseudopilin PulG